MTEITIQVSDRLKWYLDRYLPINLPIADRFYVALSEGDIVVRGKAFYLSLPNNEKLTKDMKAEDEIDQEYSLDI